MVRGSTWILLVLLGGLVGLSLFLQARKSSQLGTPTPTAPAVPLFEGSAGEPSSIRVENAAGDVVAFSRGQEGKWILTAPSGAEADQAAAEAAATQALALQVLSSVRLAPAVVGLDGPAYTLTFTFGDKTEAHRLFVGSTTPIQNGYYAQLDEGPLLVIEKFGLDALIGLLQAPPYLATPTPVATATSTTTPTTLGPVPGASEPASTATVTP